MFTLGCAYLYDLVPLRFSNLVVITSQADVSFGFDSQPLSLLWKENTGRFVFMTSPMIRTVDLQTRRMPSAVRLSCRLSLGFSVMTAFIICKNADRC